MSTQSYDNVHASIIRYLLTLTSFTYLISNEVEVADSKAAVSERTVSTTAKLSLFWSDVSLVDPTIAVRLFIAMPTVAVVILSCK